MSINETVLEMHYHRPLMNLFREAFGLGSKAKFNFYKYSTKRECFVGFDQAYVSSDLSEEVFFHALKESAESNDYKLGDIFLGYFLQFKVVKEMQVRRKYTPPQITSFPHYRVSIDTSKNINTGFSQHELLFKLSKNPGALVYYACPMLFDRSELYEQEVNLDTLRLAELPSCPSQYSDNESHFIYFNDALSEPIWCSDPTKGRAIKPSQLVSLLKERASPQVRRESALNLLRVLEEVRRIPEERPVEKRNDGEIVRGIQYVEEMLTVVRIQNPAAEG